MGRYHRRMTLPRRTLCRSALVALLLALTLAACAPRTETSEPTQVVPETPQQPEQDPALSDPAALEVERAARQAFHLMGLAFEREGVYGVNVLASELDLPSGASWRLENLTRATYALRFTSDNVPDLSWLVTPEGVARQPLTSNQIY